VIILVAGMPRSGSTFSYNIVRELLERRGIVRKEHSFDFVPLVEQEARADHVILKVHAADDLLLGLVKLGAIKAICTVRKPEDAIASWMDTFGFGLDASLEQMIRWLEMFYRLHRHALILPYDHIDRHPVRAAIRIGNMVCPDARLLEIFDVTRRYSKSKVAKVTAAMRPDPDRTDDISFSFYDRETFFHRRHVSNLKSKSARERIGEEAVSLIRSRLNKWVDEDGNLHLAASSQVTRD
jgi:hypothetical protein